MTSLQNLSLAVTNLTTAVALIPSATATTGADPGATAAQVNAAAAAIAAQTAILTADVAPAAPAVPTAPVSVTAVSVGSGAVNVSFPAVAGATGYTLNRGTTAGSEVALPLVATIPATGPVTFADTGLTVGTPYFYTVTAVNAAGNSVPSAEIQVTA